MILAFFFPFLSFLGHAGVLSWRYTIWWADSVECALPRALVLLSLHFLTCTCVHVMHLCVQNARGHFRSNKKPDTMLSDRKRKFNFRCSCMNRVISVERKRWSLTPPSLSFSLCHSCWQSLIVLDKLMKSNTEETTGSPSCSLHLPKVYVCVCIPASAYVWLSRVLRHASQSTRWWDSERVMRSSSIPSGWGPFCRREMVMNII